MAFLSPPWLAVFWSDMAPRPAKAQRGKGILPALVSCFGVGPGIGKSEEGGRFLTALVDRLLVRHGWWDEQKRKGGGRFFSALV